MEEVSSVQELCRTLIFCAIQRCRLSDELCRLTIVLKPCPQFNPPLVRISVSDTGCGSKLEEFQKLRCPTDSILAGKWDGTISIKTTCISDNEIQHFTLNLKEIEYSRMLSKLPSIMKYGAKFSGTEASLSIADGVDDLLLDITLFLQKMFTLRIPRVAVELLVDSQTVPGSQSQSCVLAVEPNPLPSSASNIELLKSGLEEYVLRHGNRKNSICHSCFPTTEHLKVGTGVASRSGTLRSNVQVMEAVVIISETSELAIPSCCRACGTMTEVFLFKDFTPCSITQSSLDGLKKIKWKDYGLSLKGIANQDGCAVLEWDNLPPCHHIDITLHGYYEEKAMMIPGAGFSQADRTLTRKALNHALSELKKKNDGALLSAHAHKIRDYAPALAKTITGLIWTSDDLKFKEECFSLLGLQSQNDEVSLVENCIKERIISVISINDRKPQRNREPAAVLFDDCCSQSDLIDVENEEGDEVFSCLDL